MRMVWWRGLWPLFAAGMLAAETGPRHTIQAGFFEKPFTLELSATNSGAVIRYTTDFSEPTAKNGFDYKGPLTISNTTVIRSAAFRGEGRVSRVATYSYLFWDQIIHQPAQPAGLPAGSHSWNGNPSAFQMDARVVNDPAYKDQMKAALQSLPALSVVCRQADMFGSSGLYFNAEERGPSWEKPCSIELIMPNGERTLQIDCGIRIQGNSNRMPWKSPKHSFRLLFKRQYGESKLHYQIFPDSNVKKFDTLVLRSDFNNSWIHWDPSQTARAQRIRDAWMKDSHRAMGWTAGHNRYVHLYLNGLYWGVYDVAERLDASFAASYFGGQKEDYDVINEFQVKNGSIDGFQSMRRLGSQREKLRQYLDVTQFIDYLLLNYYAGNQDVGEIKNWYAIGKHSRNPAFQFLVWDAEQILINPRDDTINRPYVQPFMLAGQLAQDPEYRMEFADRAQKHFFNDGALTPAKSAERWMKRSKEIDLAIIAESARWGYYRRNPPFTRNREWLAEQQRLLNEFFPIRTRMVLEQLRMAGLYPRISAPIFNQQGGKIPESFKLEITSPNAGTIYYTTNGSDPRVRGTGAVLPGTRTYTTPEALGTNTLVKARLWKQGVWSALTEASFSH